MDMSSTSNHIQIPESILKGFSFFEKIKNQNGKSEKHSFIYVLDMEGNVEKRDIKECNAKIGVYTSKKEDQLRDIECDFGKIKKKILEANKKKLSSLRISNEEYEVIKKFFLLSLSRSEEYEKNIERKMILKDFYIGNLKEDIMEKVEKIDIFSGYLPTIILAGKRSRFILPQRYFYHFDIQNNYSVAVMPISPKIAIVLYRLIGDNQGMELINFLHGQIDNMNKIAIYQEFTENKRAIYGQTKEDLEVYCSYLDELKKQNL